MFFDSKYLEAWHRKHGRLPKMETLQNNSGCGAPEFRRVGARYLPQPPPKHQSSLMPASGSREWPYPYAYVQQLHVSVATGTVLNVNSAMILHQIRAGSVFYTGVESKHPSVFKGKSQIADITTSLAAAGGTGLYLVRLTGHGHYGKLMHDCDPCPRCASSRCGTLISACMAGVRELEAFLSAWHTTHGRKPCTCKCVHSSR
jgi:hypothetical protein